MLDSRNRCKGHDPTSSVRVILNTNHEFLAERDTKPTRWRERKKRKPEKRREKRDFLTGKERGAGSSRWLCAKPSTTSVEATQRRYPRLSLRSQLLSRLAHDSSGLCRRISSSLSLSLPHGLEGCASKTEAEHRESQPDDDHVVDAVFRYVSFRFCRHCK